MMTYIDAVTMAVAITDIFSGQGCGTLLLSSFSLRSKEAMPAGYRLPLCGYMRWPILLTWLS